VTARYPHSQTLDAVISGSGNRGCPNRHARASQARDLRWPIRHLQQFDPASSDSGSIGQQLRTIDDGFATTETYPATTTTQSRAGAARSGTS
jgi:hypothetical protein